MRILLPLALAASLIVPRVAFACDDDDIEDETENEIDEPDDGDAPEAGLELATERLHESLAHLHSLWYSGRVRRGIGADGVIRFSAT